MLSLYTQALSFTQVEKNFFNITLTNLSELFQYTN